jgi:AmmeMemoRadiSam system protein A
MTSPDLNRIAEDHGEQVGATLLALARGAIANELGIEDAPAGTTDDDAPWLAEPGATFVTLTQDGRLRGCIGSLVARRQVVVDVRSNAVAAAFSDPRFPALAAVEYERTRVEVSLLSEPQPLAFGSEDEALANLRPGVDGVILEFAAWRSTFLPQVWEQVPDPATFLAHLKRKAGLPANFWHEEMRLQRYTVTKWKEVR